VFISYVAWDLLRVCVYGMTSFAEWFLYQYPQHFISPIRLSGSTVETLFSQFKHCSGGKLSPSNYAVARASHLMKHTVSSHHRSSKGYRDTPLNLVDGILQKKRRTENKHINLFVCYFMYMYVSLYMHSATKLK